MWVSGSVFGEITFPEFLGVIVVFSVGWDVSMSETNGWWGTGLSDGKKGSEGEIFHCYMFSIIKL